MHTAKIDTIASPSDCLHDLHIQLPHSQPPFLVVLCCLLLRLSCPFSPCVHGVDRVRLHVDPPFFYNADGFCMVSCFSWGCHVHPKGFMLQAPFLYACVFCDVFVHQRTSPLLLLYRVHQYRRYPSPSSYMHARANVQPNPSCNFEASCCFIICCYCLFSSTVLIQSLNLR